MRYNGLHERGKKPMFLDRDTLESVATILSQGFLLSAAVIGGAIVVAKLIEIIGVRRIFNKRKK